MSFVQIQGYFQDFITLNFLKNLGFRLSLCCIGGEGCSEKYGFSLE